MGLFNFFSKRPLNEQKVAKAARTLTNPYTQPEVRMREMERLVDDGSSVALQGVLKRFSANANGHIADEEEKKWLENALVEAGSKALEPLQGYISSETKLTYALRAYERIAGQDKAAEYFLSVLDAYGPDDYRSLEAKLQLIWQLSENLKSQDTLRRLALYLRDHSDEVRSAILELMERAVGDDAELPGVRDVLAVELSHLICTDESRPRVQRRAAELLTSLQWPLPSTEPAHDLAASLQEDFFLDKKHILRRRGPGKGTAKHV